MISFCYSDFAYNYLEGTIPSECASMNLTFASTVTYDSRAIFIDGKRRVLVSGSIHYPRSTPDMWPNLIQKSKDGGLDMIETYIFWNLHKLVRNQYNFEGRNDLVKCVKLVTAADLYVHLRIGPYVCAEWNYGNTEVHGQNCGHDEARNVCITRRTHILSQIENVYGNIDSAYGAGAKPYIKWAADMAISLDIGVPWSCASNLMLLTPLTTSGPFIATSYDYDASIDEYGLVRQPKRGHLRDVHKAIKLCEEALIATDPTISSLGPNLEINSHTVIPSFMHESLNTNANSTDSIIMDTRKMMVVWIVAMFCFSLLRFAESKVAKEEDESKFKI
ncbi:Beta-galactosidase 4 [Hibiscus syriacus]|uniref:beta-galactosidase n=1 Tax=Hibiscus syriacus TaxID=106335 RepID=A0A6A3APS5_HIBSY|nr:Beta-galactosidase 4 [Hibiscus syriacus]